MAVPCRMGFCDSGGGCAVRVENRGRVPAGNIRVYKEIIEPTLDSAIDYRVAERVAHRGYAAKYARVRREKKLQDKKGQSIKS